MEKKVNNKELEKVAAGLASTMARYRCPDCGSTDISTQRVPISSKVTIVACTCNVCGKRWNNKYDNSGGSGDLQ